MLVSDFVHSSGGPRTAHPASQLVLSSGIPYMHCCAQLFLLLTTFKCIRKCMLTILNFIFEILYSETTRSFFCNENDQVEMGTKSQ